MPHPTGILLISGCSVLSSGVNPHCEKKRRVVGGVSIRASLGWIRSNPLSLKRIALPSIR